LYYSFSLTRKTIRAAIAPITVKEGTTIILCQGQHIFMTTLTGNKSTQYV